MELPDIPVGVYGQGVVSTSFRPLYRVNRPPCAVLGCTRLADWLAADLPTPTAFGGVGACDYHASTP